MIFKPELVLKSLAGQKTQTRRPMSFRDFLSAGTVWVQGARGVDRKRYQIGQSYAVTPGRGKPTVQYFTIEYMMTGGPTHNIEHRRALYGRTDSLAPSGLRPLRIKILDITHGDVRDIRAEDIKAEGFEHHSEFFQVWCKFHDPGALKLNTADFIAGSVFDPNVLIDAWRAMLKTRLEHKYMAWALKFEIDEVK